MSLNILSICNDICYVDVIMCIVSIIELTVLDNFNKGRSGDEIEPYWEYIFTLMSGVGFVGPGFAYLSGFILMVLLLFMFVCALPCIRRKGYFQVKLFTFFVYGWDFRMFN